MLIRAKTYWPLIVTVALPVALAPSSALHAFEPHCHPQTVCTTGVGGCVPLPISLPPVDELQRIEGDGYTLGGRCGVANGNPCGKYLGKHFCPNIAECECGPGYPPCETGGGEIELVAAAKGSALSADADADDPAEYQEGMEALLPAPETAAITERLARLGAALPVPLARLWERFAAVESVHLIATVEVERAGGARESGTYEYREHGDGYRVGVELPESLGMVRVTDVASDGVLRQMYFPDMGMIAVSRQDSRMVPVALRNPLFLPLAFLLPSYETCPQCELRLADLRQVEPARGKRAPSGDVVRFADEVVHEVRLAAKEGDVLGIESREPGGRLLSRLVFSDYQPVAGDDWRFPRTIRLEQTEYDGGDDATVLTVTYRIERLAPGAPLAERAHFQIPWDRAELVWDDERRVYVKRGRGPRGRDGLDERH